MLSKWNSLIVREYNSFVEIASRWTSDATDLVHHVYMRCRRNPYPEPNAKGYFVVAMYREVTRGQFKKLYAITPPITSEPISPQDNMEVAIRRETMELYIDRLKWFDREIIKLYLDGWKMTEVARHTTIPVGTLYQSLHRSRKAIRNAVRQSKQEG